MNEIILRHIEVIVSFYSRVLMIKKKVSSYKSKNLNLYMSLPSFNSFSSHLKIKYFVKSPPAKVRIYSIGTKEFLEVLKRGLTW